MLSPVPCWHFSDDKETSAILATVLGFPHDSGNSDDVPAKPPDKVLKVMGRKGSPGWKAQQSHESWQSSGLHHIALLTSIRERVARPPLGLRYPETLWQVQRSA